MKQAYDLHHPVAIANFFIDLNRKEKHTLALLKLIKLVYIACGWQLVFNNCPLINEAVEAWEYGSIVSSVYHQFKSAGKKRIKTFGEIYDYEGDFFVILIINPDDIDVTELLHEVWEQYKHYSGMELSTMMNKTGSAWAGLVEKTEGKLLRNAHIPDSLIKKEFANLTLSLPLKLSNKITIGETSNDRK